MRIILLLAIAISVKIYLNLSKFLSAKKIHKLHTAYLHNQSNKFLQHIPQAKLLITGAGLADYQLPTSQSIGHGAYVAFNTTLIDNLGSTHKPTLYTINRLLEDTQNVYYYRMFESLSPRYWIETILFLPKNILSYLGYPTKESTTKLLQVIYWFAAPVFAFFRTELYQCIIALAEILLQII